MAIAAFQRRAPSRNVAISSARSGIADAPHVFLRKHDATSAVVGVLDLHHCRRRVQHVPARLADGQEFGGGERAACSRFGELHAGVGGRGARFVPDSVRTSPDNHVVSGVGENPERYLVRHRAARKPQRRLLAKQRCDLFLEQVDGGILAELVVADGGGCHGRTHRGARSGYRI